MTSLFNKNGLVVLAFLALLVCVFLKPVVVSRPVYDFQITFDISQSMNVEDHVGAKGAMSRLDGAKLAAQDLLTNLPCGSSVGWSVFTRRRVVSLVSPVEVCAHYDGLVSSLDNINGTMRWADASGVGKGLHQSIRAADGISETTNVIFLTDGQEAPPLRSGDRGMPKTDRFSVSGVIVGVGGLNPARIPKTYDEQGRITSYWLPEEVVQKPDAAFGQSSEELSSRQDVHLSKLGRLAELIYLPMDASDQLAKTAMVDALAHKKRVSVDLRWIPAAIALLMIILRFMPAILSPEE